MFGLLAAGAGLALMEMFGSDSDQPPEEEPDNREVVEGTDGPDILFLDGDQVGQGGEGDDRLTAEDQSEAFGGAGDDTLYGHDESTVHGDNGNDWILLDGTATGYGGAGNDMLDTEDQSEAFGGAGDNILYGDDQSTVHGDDGDDQIEVYGTATGHGDAGDDVLNIWGDASGFGGAGDDVMSVFNGGTATGGAGADTFRVLGSSSAHPEIADYQRGEDVIAVSSLSPPEGITITSDGTDSLVEVLHDGRTTTFSVLGVNDLTEEDLWFDPSQYSTFNPDHLMHWQGGTAGNDVIALPDTPTAIFAGAGDDSVTGGDGGSEFVDLGAGNDTYVGGESFSWVTGGEGDDDITVHMVPGLDCPDAAPDGEGYCGEYGNNIPAVDGGAGNDVIHVTAPSPTGQPVDWLTGLNVFGGDGDDLITSDGGGALHGGAGVDTLVGRGDASYDLRDGTGDLAQITVGGGESALVRLDALPTGWAGDLSAIDRVELTIDPSLTGPVTTVFTPSYDVEYGWIVPAQTEVFVGGVSVAVLVDGGTTAIDPLTDPRIALL